MFKIWNYSFNHMIMFYIYLIIFEMISRDYCIYIISTMHDILFFDSSCVVLLKFMTTFKIIVTYTIVFIVKTWCGLCKIDYTYVL